MRKVLLPILRALAVALLAALGTAQIALADQVNGSINLQETGWNATGTLTTTGTTSGSWTLVLDFANTTAVNTDINSFAVQLFSASSTETFSISTATINGSSALGNWEFFPDDKLNNGSTPDCSTSSVKGWVCGDTAHNLTSKITPFVVNAGTTTEFILSGTFYAPGGPVSQLDLMASGCKDAGTCNLDGGTNNGNSWAVSGILGGTTSTPEPSSIMLLGSGLGFLGMVLRRRKSLFNLLTA